MYADLVSAAMPPHSGKEDSEGLRAVRSPLLYRRLRAVGGCLGLTEGCGKARVVWEAERRREARVVSEAGGCREARVVWEAEAVGG